MEALSRVMRKPARLLVIVIGGAKIADKLGVIRHFGINRLFFIGRRAGNTVLKAKGVDIQNSLL